MNVKDTSMALDARFPQPSLGAGSAGMTNDPKITSLQGMLSLTMVSLYYLEKA